MGAQTPIDREEISRKILRSLPLPLFLIDGEHRFVMVNEAFQNQFCSSADLPIGRSVWEIWSRDAHPALSTAYDQVFSHRGQEVVEVGSPEDGKVSDLQVTYFGGLAIVVCQDVTERARRERTLAIQVDELTALQATGTPQRAYEPVLDPLTGLTTLARGQQLAASIFRATAQKDAPMSLIEVDIDDFGSLPVGSRRDEVVIGLARVLRQFCTDHEIPVRQTHGKFLVLCPGLGTALAKRRAVSLLERVRNAKNSIASATVCLGVASVDSSDCGPTELFNRARLALEAAQSSGRDRVAVWGTDTAPSEEF